MTGRVPRMQPVTRVPARESDADVACPVHRTKMLYYAADDKYACPEQGCEKTAWRRRSFTETFERSGPDPAVYRGAIELVLDDKGHKYLYLPDAHAMVDISGMWEEGGADPKAEWLTENELIERSIADSRMILHDSEHWVKSRFLAAERVSMQVVKPDRIIHITNP